MHSPLNRHRTLSKISSTQGGRGKEEEAAGKTCPLLITLVVKKHFNGKLEGFTQRIRTEGRAPVVLEIF
jgi:hypothetical protein